jgi:hypothetical protein
MNAATNAKHQNLTLLHVINVLLGRRMPIGVCITRYLSQLVFNAAIIILLLTVNVLCSYSKTSSRTA